MDASIALRGGDRAHPPPTTPSTASRVTRALQTEWTSPFAQQFVLVVLVVCFLLLSFAWFRLYCGTDVGAPMPKGDTEWHVQSCFDSKWRAAARWMHATVDCYASRITCPGVCGGRAQASSGAAWSSCVARHIEHVFPHAYKWSGDDRSWLIPALRHRFGLASGDRLLATPYLPDGGSPAQA